MSKKQKTIIVGGVAGGASAAARLRRLDEKAEIIILERGEYISFANCGLPYYIGEKITEKSALILQTKQSFKDRFNVDIRLFSEAISINVESKTIDIKNLETSEIYQESYDKLILSMGAEPIKPNITGLDSEKIFVLRNIPDTYKIKEYIDNNKPQKAVVVGGGFIGIEMAENLRILGLDVTIIEQSKQVIAPLDCDMVQDVHKYIRAKGIKLILNNSIISITKEESKLNIILKDGEEKADMIILSIGVTPESKLAKDAGLETNSGGAVIVTDEMLTSKESIYAVGDLIEVSDFITGEKTFIPLAGPANKQGRIAADNICGGDSKYQGTQGSAILKIFDMTVATTGINEKKAKKLNLNYDKIFTNSLNHAGYYPGALNMVIKTIFEKETGKILGAQIVGFDGVDKRCDVLATAIHFGATAYDLAKLELCYAPPFSSAKDPVNMIGFAIENVLTGKVKNFHWHNVSELPRDGSVILLDIRTEFEFERGSIDGFINIPLDELRENLDMFDKNKKIYVTCQVGLRGYIAARILAGNGFDVYNLSGGYKLYNLITEYIN